MPGSIMRVDARGLRLQLSMKDFSCFSRQGGWDGAGWGGVGRGGAGLGIAKWERWSGIERGGAPLSWNRDSSGKQSIRKEGMNGKYDVIGIHDDTCTKRSSDCRCGVEECR